VPPAGHDDQPSILLLEDTVEYAYRLDRSLHHLRRAGYFDNVAGMILSDLRLKDDGPANSLGMSLSEIIDDHFSGFDGPIALDVPCGHTDFQLTIPLGCEASLRVAEDKMSIDIGDLWNERPKASGATTTPGLSRASEKMRTGGAMLAGRFKAHLRKRA
jgi:muramoyltetrapeptide carboxypeptidase LdcA involved in peptidoglycan recycling